MAPHIVIVHYAERVPSDPGFTESRYSATARALVRRGAKVTRLYPSFAHGSRKQRAGPADWEDEELGRFRAVATPGYARSMGVERVRFLRAFVTRSAKIVSDLRPDVVLAGYPPPGMASAIVRRMGSRRPRVLVDVRDLWPDAQLSSQRGARGAVVRAIEPMVRRLTREDLVVADGLIAISSEYLRWAEDAAGRRWPRAHTTIVPLGANLWNGPSGSPGTPSKREGVVFVGSLSDHFDFNLLLSAWKRVVAERPDLARAHPLTIIGEGDRAHELRGLADATEGVALLGRRPHHEAMHLVSAHLVGVAPYKRGAAMGLPNKLFEYMACGVAVLSTLEGEAERLIHNGATGRSVGAHTPAALSAEIVRLLGHPEEALRMGRRGRELVESSYSRAALGASLAAFIMRDSS